MQKCELEYYWRGNIVPLIIPWTSPSLWRGFLFDRAKVRLGEISKDLETDKPGPKNTSQHREVTPKKQTLKSAGVSTSEAHRCEQLAEFDLRWNERKLNDDERARSIIMNTPKKRLLYRQNCLQQ